MAEIDLTWTAGCDWINIYVMSSHDVIDIFTLGVTWDDHNRQTLSPVLTHDGPRHTVTK